MNCRIAGRGSGLETTCLGKTCLLLALVAMTEDRTETAGATLSKHGSG